MGIQIGKNEVSFNRILNYPLVWVTEADGACSFLNQNWCSFTGQAPEKGLGIGWMQAIDADERKLVARLFLKANVKHMPFQIEYRLRCSDGTYPWVNNTATPCFDKEGGFIGYIGLVNGIVGRKVNDKVCASIMPEDHPQPKISLEVVQAIPWLSRRGNTEYLLPTIGKSLKSFVNAHVQ